MSTVGRPEVPGPEACGRDDLAAVFCLLADAHIALERQLGRVLDHQVGLPHSWFEVMLRISRAEDGLLPMSTLAEQVGLTTGGVTRLFDRMLAAGLVERVACESDRRVVYAGLSHEGRERLEEAAEVHLTNLRQLFVGVSRAEREELAATLARIGEARLAS